MLKPAERGRTSGMRGAMQGVAAAIRKVPAHTQWGLLISVQSRSFTHRLCPVAAICNFKTQPVPRQCPTCLVLSFLSLSRSLFPTEHTATYTHIYSKALHNNPSQPTGPFQPNVCFPLLVPLLIFLLLFILYTITFQPYTHTFSCSSSVSPYSKRCLLHKGLISTPANHNTKEQAVLDICRLSNLAKRISNLYTVSQ